MKIRVSIKKICNNCKSLKRRNRLYIMCKIKKHKQRQK